MMETINEKILARLRIILAIAVKDISDAIKNKTILTMMFGLTLMMVTSQVLPLLLKLNPVPKAFVYDNGKSNLIKEIGQSDRFVLRMIPSLHELELGVSEASEVVLGLVVPLDFDQNTERGESVQIESYVMHWANDEKVEELLAFFQEQIQHSAGQTVHINPEVNLIYPQQDSGGRPFMLSMGLVFAIIVIGSFLVPYLMIEEKETHTLDTLLVSPATYAEVVIGKAIAGSIYSLAAVAIVLAFNHSMVNLWGIAFLAAVCGAFFSVTIGLFIGVLFNNPSTMNLWLGFVIVILLVPVFLSGAFGATLPELVKEIIPWVPSVSLAQIFQSSFTNTNSFGLILSNLTVVIGSAVLILLLVVWQIRQSDR